MYYTSARAMFSPNRHGSLAFQSRRITSLETRAFALKIATPRIRDVPSKDDAEKLLAGNIELLSGLQETIHMRKGEK